MFRLFATLTLVAVIASASHSLAGQPPAGTGTGAAAGAGAMATGAAGTKAAADTGAAISTAPATEVRGQQVTVIYDQYGWVYNYVIAILCIVALYFIYRYFSKPSEPTTK